MALTTNEIEAAIRAEATALLIRGGFRVYRPEADCYGEDLILRHPKGKLLAVQMKARPTVNQNKYGGKSLWMLFPDPLGNISLGRKWFLVPHDRFYRWTEGRHRHTASIKQKKAWSAGRISQAMGQFLQRFIVHSS
jgi:hypothetical protein